MILAVSADEMRVTDCQEEEDVRDETAATNGLSRELAWAAVGVME